MTKLSLAALAARQKEKQNESVAEHQADGNDVKQDSNRDAEVSSSDSASAEPVQADAPPAQPAPATQSDAPKTGGLKLGGLKGLKLGAGSQQPAKRDEPAAVPESREPTAKPVASGLSKLRIGNGASAVNPSDEVSGGRDSDKSESGNVSGNGITLADLAGSESTSNDNPELRRFDDEVEATKPNRELPESMMGEEGAKQFVGLLDGLYEVLFDAELFGQMIRLIMEELRANPEYAKILAPEDARAMIKGLRESMGMAQIKKAETKTKRSSGPKKGTELTAEKLDNLEALFGQGAFDD